MEAIEAQEFELAANIRDKEREKQRELKKLVGDEKKEAGEPTADLDSDPWLLNRIVVENLFKSFTKTMEKKDPSELD